MRFRGPQALSDTFGTLVSVTTSIHAGTEGVSLMGEIRGQLSENLLEPEDFWAVDRHGLGLKVRPSLVPKLQLFDYRAVREAMLITRHLPPAAKPTF